MGRRRRRPIGDRPAEEPATEGAAARTGGCRSSVVPPRWWWRGGVLGVYDVSQQRRPKEHVHVYTWCLKTMAAWRTSPVVACRRLPTHLVDVAVLLQVVVGVARVHPGAHIVDLRSPHHGSRRSVPDGWGRRTSTKSDAVPLYVPTSTQDVKATDRSRDRCDATSSRNWRGSAGSEPNPGE